MSQVIQLVAENKQVAPRSLIRWAETSEGLVGFCGKVAVARVMSEPIVTETMAGLQRELNNFVLHLEVYHGLKQNFGRLSDAMAEAELLIANYKRNLGW